MSITRTLPAGVEAETQQQHTRPLHLVKLELLSGTTLYLSEGAQITFDSQTYLEGRVQVSALGWTAEGEQRCTIEILNENGVAASLFLNNQFTDATVSVYLTYIKADNTNTTPVLYVKGAVDTSDLSPESATLSVVTSRFLTEFVPNRYFLKANGFNWLPPEGSIVFWNGERYKLEADRG